MNFEEQPTENQEDVWSTITTVFDLILACAVCFSVFIIVYTGGVFMGVWK